MVNRRRVLSIRRWCPNAGSTPARRCRRSASALSAPTTFRPTKSPTPCRGAIEVGYRHLDCASVYGNEDRIGAALREVGVPRDELWITSKLWNDKHAESDVIPSCRKSLADLQLDYLDMYLVHWPFPNFHPPGCSVESRSPDARPYIHENFMKTWRQMEKLVDLGLTRHIGTSNMTIPKLKLLLRDARIKPAVNEMELHPHFQQPELFEFVRANGIEPIGYSPIGSPNRPERDRTPGRHGRYRGPRDCRASRSGSGFTPRSSASSGRCSAARRRFRNRRSGATIWRTCRAS